MLKSRGASYLLLGARAGRAQPAQHKHKIWARWNPRNEGMGALRCLMNLPNSLTILRIFFVPLLVVVLLTRQPNFNFWGLPMNFAVWGVLILLTAAATDYLDGYYARRRE